jgi:hypothetical protein
VLTADLQEHLVWGDLELQEFVNVAREKAHAKVETYGVEQALQRILKAMRWSVRLDQSTHEYGNDEVGEVQDCDCGVERHASRADGHDTVLRRVLWCRHVHQLAPVCAVLSGVCCVRSVLRLV